MSADSLSPALFPASDDGSRLEETLAPLGYRPVPGYRLASSNRWARQEWAPSLSEPVLVPPGGLDLIPVTLNSLSPDMKESFDRSHISSIPLFPDSTFVYAPMATGAAATSQCEIQQWIHEGWQIRTGRE